MARKPFYLIIVLILCATTARAQFNINRMLVSGEVALQYEDYVLSIQYFNRIINQRPNLYQPWHLRGAAKFYLDDYQGAEADASEAIRLNPYVDLIYDLRAISRIRQNDYKNAITDYTSAININPTQRNYWFNRAICNMQIKDYDLALAQTDTIIRRWSGFASAYSLKAEILLHQNDTTEAVRWLDKSLEVDPYDGNTWMTNASISLSRQEWNRADSCLTQAIHLRPMHVGSYLNRALARYNMNKLSGAMSDYNLALDIDPNNFLAHYNRGLLLMQLGADNDALDDFDYVLTIEPENVMAIFNRGLLRDNTGDLIGAIEDYTKVINQFPNFWTGLEQRAACYRKLGQIGLAEKDEFVVYKAQMDKRLGIQPRWTEEQVREVRKRGEIDPDMYGSLVVDDSDAIQEYQSEYRGRIQNRKVEFNYQPMLDDSEELTEADMTYNQAMVYIINGEKANAIAALSSAIQQDPRLAQAYYNRGLLYYNQGDKNAAIQDLSKAGELGLYDAYSVMKKMKP